MDSVGWEKSDRFHMEVATARYAVQLQMRRFTRLTNGHSKRWENHAAMIGLYFGWYNYCRVHSTIKTTPAVAQGLADKPWSIEELLAAAA